MSPNRYVQTTITIDQGQALTFLNQDPLVQHTVTATLQDAAGQPLFDSGVVKGGGQAAVAGVPALAPGAYAFFCTIHPTQMRGMLTVRGAADTVAPRVAVRVGSASRSAVLRRRHLYATVVLDEAATVVVRASTGGRTLARRRFALAAGTTRVALPLAAPARRALRAHARVTVAVRASDAAGNAASVVARRRLG